MIPFLLRSIDDSLFIHDRQIMHINDPQMWPIGLCEDRIVHDHIPMNGRTNACAELNELRRMGRNEVDVPEEIPLADVREGCMFDAEEVWQYFVHDNHVGCIVV